MGRIQYVSLEATRMMLILDLACKLYSMQRIKVDADILSTYTGSGLW
jgi:hypothetical protein